MDLEFGEPGEPPPDLRPSRYSILAELEPLRSRRGEWCRIGSWYPTTKAAQDRKKRLREATKRAGAMGAWEIQVGLGPSGQRGVWMRYVGKPDAAGIPDAIAARAAALAAQPAGSAKPVAGGRFDCPDCGQQFGAAMHLGRHRQVRHLGTPPAGEPDERTTAAYIGKAHRNGGFS